MKTPLKVLFVFVFCWMIYITVIASLDQNVIEAIKGIPSPLWWKATLSDTYFAFLTFYLWVFYKETNWFSRIFWFLAIMLLGNIAISSYMLIQLFRLKPQDPVSKILTR